MDFKAYRDSGRKRAKKMHGGKEHHSDEAEDKKLIKKEIGKAKIKLKSGGHVDGEKAAKRLDKPVRPGRQALKTGGKSKHKGGTRVNVIVAGSPSGGAGGPPMGAMGARPPMPPGMAPQAAMPPRPPMAPPPGGGGMPMPPPGGAPGMPPKPPGMMNKGGRINTKIKAPKMKDGAGGGKGRMEKAKEYGAKPLARGGSCESEE